MERLKDINVSKVVTTHDPLGNICQVEISGEDLNGQGTWILLHIDPNVPPTLKLTTFTDE